VDSSGTEASGARHATGDTTRIIVSHVRAKGGDDAVARVLAAAGDRRSAQELEQDTCWSSYEQACALFDAAVEVLGDAHTFRDLSAVHDANRRRANRVGGETTRVFQTLGSPGEIFEHIDVVATRYLTVARMEAVQVADDFAVVAATGTDEFPRYPALCDFTAGLMGSAPILFGFEPATVIEEACQHRGDDRCVFRVTWDPTVDERDEPVLRHRNLELQVSLLTARLNNLRAAAADLVSGDDLDTVLARVTARAGIAVRAPRFLLVLATEPGQPPRIHHDGFTSADEAGKLAARVQGQEPALDDSLLVVEVRSGRRTYGSLVACYPPGSTYFPEERVLLEAYAGLAAAALDAATALDEARRQAETASVLLALADALAKVGSAGDVTVRLAEAVPTVIAAERSVVMLWDPVDEVLRTSASHGLPPAADALMRDLTISRTDTPLLANLMADGTPHFIDAATENPFMHDVLHRSGATSVVAVPIMGASGFLGIVCAGTTSATSPLRGDPHGVARVRGIAAQASVALQNAMLLEQVRHQAMHDALTGLPGRELLIELTEQALRVASRDGHHVGLLFADIDRLKDINDTLGHRIGDEVIRSLAQRLRSALRDADVLARLGGDEFVVILPQGTAATVDAVTRKLRAALDEPLRIGGHVLAISASIGAAIFPDDGDTYETLIARADAAMYVRKASARGASAAVTAWGRRS